MRRLRRWCFIRLVREWRGIVGFIREMWQYEEGALQKHARVGAFIICNDFWLMSFRGVDDQLYR